MKYMPQSFQNFYTPALAPVLHIFPGDSVRPAPWTAGARISTASLARRAAIP